MSFLVRSIFLLCFLFLSSFGSSFAHLYPASDRQTASDLAHGVVHSSSTTVDGSNPALLKMSHASGAIEIKIEAPELKEEEEEREWSSSKNNRDRCNYFDRFYFAFLHAYFSRTNRESFSGADHSSELSSSRRHLRLQVFRI